MVDKRPSEVLQLGSVSGGGLVGAHGVQTSAGKALRFFGRLGLEGSARTEST